jgi:bla regulator protein BlaR1
MISAVADHLWQSTLFACVIGLLTASLKSNRAAVRHGLWLVASVKFLVPFSVLIGLGGQIEWQKAPRVHDVRLDTLEKAGEPLAVLASPARSLPQNSSSPIPTVLFSFWLCGFAASSLSRCGLWWQVRAISRAASPLPLNLPIKALSSSAHLEPGVFGIFRPVLLLPDGFREHLTRAQFEAIIAHELCHVRRRDNLVFAIHMIVEAVFWFYPPVRWIGTRLIEERERACDEAVLRMGSDPQDYAEGIVTVCRLYLKSPLACVSGVTGSDLKRRVETIMLNRVGESMDIGRKLLLFVALSAAVTTPLIVGAMNAPLFLAQERAKPLPQLVATSALPEFEVASIRPSAPHSNLKVDFAPGGKLFISDATLRFLIKIAYDIGDDQLAGGPGWIGAKRFNLAAIPDVPLGGDPKNMAPDQILVFHKPTRLRLQRLLADRFQLELRKESTPMPIFALVVAEGRSKKLTPTKITGDPQLNANPGNGELAATGVDMATLAKFLSEGQTGRPVVDMTGLKDKYDFHLEWSPDTSQAALPADSSANQQPVDAGGISIFSALQQQLGLKLVPRTSAADRLVVVRAELPTAN